MLVIQVTVAVNLLQNSPALSQGNNEEWHYVRNDGTTFFVSVNFTAIKDTRGNVTSYLAMQEREPSGVIASPAIWQLDNTTGKILDR